MLDNVQFSIFRKDKQVNYRGANKQFLDCHGLQERAIIGRKTCDVIPHGNAHYL